MREPLAVLSDIHGNIRALDAVLDEIARRGIRRTVNLGDSLYGPFDPRPAADRLMTLGIPTVSGNEDRILQTASTGSRTAGRPPARTAEFTRQQLEPRHFSWLASLPLTAVVDGAFLCHGTPSDDTPYLLSSVLGGSLALRPEAEVDRLTASVAERVILCGHDHTPRLAACGGKLIVNPGSVGCPAYVDDVPEEHVVENGSPDARFAIVCPRVGAAATVELISVPYDAAAASDEAYSSGFADWARWIASGRAE